MRLDEIVQDKHFEAATQAYFAEIGTDTILVRNSMEGDDALFRKTVRNIVNNLKKARDELVQFRAGELREATDHEL